MIRLTVEYDDDVMKSYEGVSFQHTDKGLTLNLNGGVVVVPDKKIRAYAITRVEVDEEAKDQTKEPGGEDVVDAEILTEEGTIEEEDTPQEEA